MDEPQRGNDGGTRKQWMNHKGGTKGAQGGNGWERRGHKGAMDEPQGENEGGTRG